MILALPAENTYSGSPEARSREESALMAYIEGYPPQQSARSIVKHIGFMMIVLSVIIVFLLDFSSNWLGQLVSSVVPIMIILSLMLYVSFKVNPTEWKRLVRRQAYLRSAELDRAIADEILKLDDEHFILHDFVFELFHIEFIIVSRGGIFVLGKTEKTGPLEVRDGILFQGGRTLETLTGNLWRVCNLVNIVLKKGYQIDVMPQPVLVVPEALDLTVSSYDDIAVVKPSGIVPLVRSRKRDALSAEIAQGFSYYLKQRYASRS